MDDFKRDDPNVITPLPGVERRVQETVIIQRESSNAAWWGVGILAALAVVTLLWFLTRPAEQATDADLRVAQAEAAAESARQTAEAALVQNQLNGARDSVAIAQAQTATARAEDFLGLYEGELYLLLIDIAKDTVENVRQRLRQKGIQSQAVGDRL